MILSMPHQTLLFLFTAGAGAAIGLLYDILRIFRKTAPHKNFFVQIEDFLFWLAATFFIFYFMLLKNYGEIRFFSIIGVAAGFALYNGTLSPVIVKIFVAVINFIKRVVAAAIRIVLLPARLLVKLLTPLYKAGKKFIIKCLYALRLFFYRKIRNAARNINIIRKKV